MLVDIRKSQLYRHVTSVTKCTMLHIKKKINATILVDSRKGQLYSFVT